MRRRALLLGLVLLLVVSCGCTGEITSTPLSTATPTTTTLPPSQEVEQLRDELARTKAELEELEKIEEEHTLMSSEEIYSEYKDSIFYIDMYCNLILTYPSFTINWDYDNYYYDDYLEISLDEVNEVIKFQSASGALGTGFIVNDNLISNAHVAYCEKEDELFYIQDYLNYLRDLSTNYYLNQTDIESLTDYDVSRKAIEIYNSVKRQNYNTEWTERDIEDYITSEITFFLLNNLAVSSIKEDKILAYSPKTGYDEEYELMIIKVGEPYPGNDYAILGFDGSSNFESLKYGNSDEVRIGEDIYTIGYPDSFVLDYNVFNEPSITKGIVTSRQTTEQGIRYIQIDAATSGGSSGSPVFNKYGQVIGIMTAGYGESFNSVLPSNTFKNE